MITLKKLTYRGLTALAATALLTGIAAQSVAAYPPTTTTTPANRTIDATAFAPTCIGNVPYIEFAITTSGFSPVGGATLVFTDIAGNPVVTEAVSSLSGRVIYPGAAAGPDGKGIDWPGWKRVGDSWVRDSSDAIVRDGLNVEVIVEAPTGQSGQTEQLTATTTVSYPPQDSACANPSQVSPSNGGGTGGNGGGQLPETGSSGLTGTMQIAGLTLLGGLAIVAVAALSRRRVTPDAT